MGQHDLASSPRYTRGVDLAKDAKRELIKYPT